MLFEVGGEQYGIDLSKKNARAFRQELAADAVVLVTSRLSHGGLYTELQARKPEWVQGGVSSV